MGIWCETVHLNSKATLFIHKESSPGHAHPAKQSAGMTSKHSPQNHPVPRSRLPHALLFQSGQTLKKPLGGVTVSQGVSAWTMEVDLNMGNTELLTWKISTFPSGQAGPHCLPITKIPFLKTSFSKHALTTTFGNVKNSQTFWQVSHAYYWKLRCLNDATVFLGKVQSPVSGPARCWLFHRVFH